MTRPRRSRTAVVKLLLGAAFIALLVGGAATVAGVAGLVSNPDAVPTCDGKAMSAGERCDVLRGGSTVDTYTYDEKIGRQHRDKDRAGDTITIGITVTTVSLLAGVLVEVVSRRSAPETPSLAGTPWRPPPAPPESVGPVPTPRSSGTTSRRGPYRAVIAGVAGVVCAALAVLVTLVVINRSDSAGASSPARGSAAASATRTTNGPDVADLMRAMPAVLRGDSECESPGIMSRDRFVISSGTCHLRTDSQAIAGLVAVPSLGRIFEAAIVSSPSSYRESQWSGNRVIRDDDAVYAVFALSTGNSDPPELGNTLRCLDMRTGLLIVVDGANNEQDAATILERAGF